MNLEGTERIYTKGAGPMCPRDGYVLFRNSELLCGRLGKQTLGGGNKASLFQARHHRCILCSNICEQHVYSCSTAISKTVMAHLITTHLCMTWICALCSVYS